jgi:Domain of unknown function DUF29
MADLQEISLYERDFYQWALEQARAVRELHEAAALPRSLRQCLDWDHLIEELEGLATGVRSELRSRLITIVQHLVKLELSSAADPRRGWEETVQRSRLDIELLLEDSPSLRREMPMLLRSPLMTKAGKAALEDLVRRGEVPEETPVPAYTQEQLTEDWWPGRDGEKR